jgi:hypothetical protein
VNNLERLEHPRCPVFPGVLLRGISIYVVLVCAMDLKKRYTINDFCEMEARGETCPELEEAHREMALTIERLGPVLPDFVTNAERLRIPAFDAVSQLRQAAFDNPVGRLTRDLEALNLGVSSQIKELTRAVEVAGMSNLTNTIADMGRGHLSELQKIHEGLLTSALPKSSTEKFLEDMREQAQTLPTSMKGRFTPLVDPLMAIPDLEINPIQQEIFEATREQNQVMRENSVLLIEQMKVQTTNSEKLVKVTIAATEANIASKKRNDRQFVIMVILSILMAWGSLPTIINTVNTVLHWLKIR